MDRAGTPGLEAHVMAWRYIVLDAMARRLGPPPGGRNTVLVHTPGHLGDILHAVPMLKALKSGMPGRKILWLVGPWSEALARRYEDVVDEIRVFGPDLPPFTRGRREWRQSAWRQWRMALALRGEGIEILIAPLNGVGRFLANAVCPRRWIGIGDRRPPRVRPGIDTTVQPYEKDRYEADALCALLASLGIEAHADRLEYAVTAVERQEAEALRRASGVVADRPLALIAPGSGWSGKNWFPDRFAEVADWLVRDHGFQVAWVGGPGEESLVPASRREDVHWVGRTPLPVLAAVMEDARLFVGNDGGLMHLAAALDLPTVSVWGPTSPGKWGPKGSLHRQIRKVDRCDGCIYWDYRESCRHDQACMKAVDVAEVQQRIRDLMPAIRNRQPRESAP